MSETLQYAYAVTPQPGDSRLPDDLHGLHGVSGAPVHVVAGEGVAAVVSPVPAEDFDEAPLRTHLEDIDWLEPVARAHQQVVDAVASAGCAVPLQLATVYRGEQGVRRMLAAGRDRFEAAFEVLDGRDEWGVKLYAGPVLEESVDRPSTGRDYLRQRQRDRRARDESWQRAEDWAREVHEALSALADHTRLHRPQDGRLSGAAGQNVLNGAYLVSREKAADFAALVGELADRAVGLRIDLTGPWAPYSFAGAAAGDGTAGAAAGDDTADAGAGGGTVAGAGGAR